MNNNIKDSIVEWEKIKEMTLNKDADNTTKDAILYLVNMFISNLKSIDEKNKSSTSQNKYLEFFDFLEWYLQNRSRYSSSESKYMVKEYIKIMYDE